MLSTVQVFSLAEGESQLEDIFRRKLAKSIEIRSEILITSGDLGLIGTLIHVIECDGFFIWVTLGVEQSEALERIGIDRVLICALTGVFKSRGEQDTSQGALAVIERLPGWGREDRAK